MIVVGEGALFDIRDIGLETGHRYLCEVGVALGELGFEVCEYTEQIVGEQDLPVGAGTRPDADGVRFIAEAPSRAVLIAGRPLNEPIAQYGPFVMNTRDELMQAVRDYQSGNFA